jgi:hypothetical protein
MSALRVQLADAIVAELNASGLTPAFTAVRRRVPIDDVKALRTVQVSVIPATYEETPASRTADEREFVLGVAVQQHLDVPEADADGLDELVERILALFNRRRLSLTGGDVAVWTSAGNDPMYILQHLAEKHVYTSVIRLTWKVVTPA